MALVTPPRVRRKPVPVADDVDDGGKVNWNRQSFTLYPDAPVSVQLSPHATSLSASPSISPNFHYTRRSTQSNVTSSLNHTIPSTPTRTRLARLLLPSSSSPASGRVRKHVISGPAPAELPAGMIPPELAALAKSQRPMVLRPIAPVISPTASESSATSEDSRVSAATEATSPPLSPLDVISPSPTLQNSRTPPPSPFKAPSKSKSKPAPHFPLEAPTAAALALAASLPLVAPSGVRVSFGVLLGQQPQAPAADAKSSALRRTLVIFLRHFWCPLCQDYMVALVRGVRCAMAIPDDDDDDDDSTPGSPTMPVFANSASADYDPFPMPMPTASSSSSSSARRPDTSSSTTSTSTRPAPWHAERCPACTSSASVTLAYLDGLVTGDAHDRYEAEDPTKKNSSDDETRSQREEEEQGTGEGTHLLLVAPGSHTLIARYLASFGFPRELVTPTTEYPTKQISEASGGEEGHAYPYAKKGFDLGDPLYPPALPSPFQSTGSRLALDDGHLPSGRGRSGIASVRMFVDPHPAQGVYAALGMGWMVSASTGAPGSDAAAGLVGEIQVQAPTPPGSPTLAIPIPFPSVRSSNSESSGLKVLAEQCQCGSESSHEKNGQKPVEDPHAASGDAGEAYVTHGVLSGVGAVVMRALRAGMPMWARGGDIGLLGGEFVFEVGHGQTLGGTAAPSLRCTYAHRMQTTRGHAGVERVLAAAGVRLPEGFTLASSSGNKGMAKAKGRDTLKKSNSRNESLTALPRSASADVANVKTASASLLLPRSASMTPTLSFSVATSRPPATPPPPPVAERLSTVPRSMSTPMSSSMSASRGMFARFAGPRGARAPASTNNKGRAPPNSNSRLGGVETQPPAAQEGNVTRVPLHAQRVQNDHLGLPRSASTPPGTVIRDEVAAHGAVLKGAAAVWEGRHPLWEKPEGRHWGGVGVIWENRVAKEGRGARVREPAIPESLTASSSRPWALAATGSCESLTSLAVSGEEIQPREEAASSTSSSSLSLAPKAVHGKELTESSTSSDSEAPSEALMAYPRAETEEAFASGSEADDEMSQNDRFLPLPRVKHPALEESGSEHSHTTRTHDESDFSHATHGHEHEVAESDVYGAPDLVENSWMSARTLSLARLRARKEARRGWGHSVDV